MVKAIIKKSSIIYGESFNKVTLTGIWCWLFIVQTVLWGAIAIVDIIKALTN